LASDNCFTRLVSLSEAKIIGNDETAKVRIIMTTIPGKIKFIVVMFSSGMIFLPQTTPATIVQTMGKAKPKNHAQGFFSHLKKLNL
jgi:hypothetical protein